MKATCSSEYVQKTLRKALQYFSRIQKINLIDKDEDQRLNSESINMMHNSYELFIQCLPSNVASDTKMNQKQIRQLYLQTFDAKKISVPKPILKSNRTNWVLWLGNNVTEDEIENAFRPYFENSSHTFSCNQNDNSVIPVKMISDTILDADKTNRSSNNESNLGVDISQLVVNNQTGDKEQDDRLVNNCHSVYYVERFFISSSRSPSMPNDEKTNDAKKIQNLEEKGGSTEVMLASFEALCRDINKKQRRILQREFERQSNLI
jgi:hypothetical protein